MPLKSDEVSLPGNIKEVYVYDAREPTRRDLAYRMDKDKSKIEFFPKRERPPFLLDKITVEGFSKLPSEFSQFGYVKSGAVYYLNKMLSGKQVKRIVISRKSKDDFRKYRGLYYLTLNYNSFKILNDRLTSIKSDSKYERSHSADEFFHDLFPTKCGKPKITTRRRVTRIISNLDKSIIQELESSEVEKFLDFFEHLLISKYKSAVYKRKLLRSAKIKVDSVALTDIISEFERMLTKNPLEDKWSEFLKKYLFLLDSRYIDSMPNLNVVTAGARNVDFGLIDSQEYLDIFEIKRPSTRLLSDSRDRGNYYWHNEAVRAVVQAEKYLYNAETKSPILERDIRRELGREVKVTRPRVILLIGSTSQLDNADKKEDFRVLRMSFRNLEIVLYDELLERLKNQKGRVYSE